MKKTLIALLGLSIFALQGCVLSISDDGVDSSRSYHSEADREEENRDFIADVDVGISVDTVRRALGTPDFNEIVMSDDKKYTILYYRTHRMHSDGNTTKDECTPMLFVDNKLVGVGETALNRI